MPAITEIRTDRLLMRRWRDEDRAPFADLNADPEVMEHFPSVMTREQSDALADVCAARLAENGHGLWALELTATGEFIGFTGLNPVTFAAPFTPAVEIGWRLRRSAWGHGYASEAARAALAHGFTVAGLDAVVSFTATTNLRSQAVMRRIGMIRDDDGDFHHPGVGDTAHPLSRHVLYRIDAAQWGIRR